MNKLYSRRANAILARVIEAARGPTTILNSFTLQHHALMDKIATRLTSRSIFFPHGFFEDGWGKREVRDQYESEVRDQYVVRTPIAPVMGEVVVEQGISTQTGSFPSTAPDARAVLPPESHQALFEVVRPADQLAPGGPAVVLVPGLGEPWRLRKITAEQLAARGLTVVVLEGPFFGARRPPYQAGSKLRTAADLLILGRATIEEGRSLLGWLRSEGYGPLAVAGCSMGGLHSGMIGSLTGNEDNLPIGIVGHVAAPSAYHAFCLGVLSQAVHTSKFWSSNKWRPADYDPFAELKRFFQLTELTNFECPPKPSASIFTVGQADEYLPTDAARQFWKGFKNKWQTDSVVVREVEAGHISGILLGSHTFQSAICEVLENDELKAWYADNKIALCDDLAEPIVGEPQVS